MRTTLVLALAVSLLSSTIARGELVVPPLVNEGTTTMSVGEPTTAPSGAFLVLGGGYDVLTGAYLPGQCVDSRNDPLSFGKSELEGSFSTTFINAVQDMQTSASAGGSDFGFNFAYKLVSVGFGSGSNSGSFFNSVDSFGRVFRRIVTRGESLTGEGWSALGKIEIGNSLARFNQICGTHYIRAIYRGHTIDQTYKFALTKTSTTSSDRDGLSFDVGKIFGFNYGDTSSSEKVDKLSTLSIDDQSRGVLPSMPVDSTTANGVVQLVKWARNDFRDQVLAAAPNTAMPVLVELVPYANLPATGSQKIPSWPGDLMGGVSARTGLYQSFLTVLGDITRAKDLPTSVAANFYENPASAAGKFTEALAVQENYRKAVETCVELLVDDEEPDDASACNEGLSSALNPTIVEGLRMQIK